VPAAAVAASAFVISTAPDVRVPAAAVAASAFVISTAPDVRVPAAAVVASPVVIAIAPDVRVPAAAVAASIIVAATAPDVHVPAAAVAASAVVTATAWELNEPVHSPLNFSLYGLITSDSDDDNFELVPDVASPAAIPTQPDAAALDVAASDSKFCDRDTSMSDDVPTVVRDFIGLPCTTGLSLCTDGLPVQCFVALESENSVISCSWIAVRNLFTEMLRGHWVGLKSSPYFPGIEMLDRSDERAFQVIATVYDAFDVRGVYHPLRTVYIVSWEDESGSRDSAAFLVDDVNPAVAFVYDARVCYFAGKYTYDKKRKHAWRRETSTGDMGILPVPAQCLLQLFCGIIGAVVGSPSSSVSLANVVHPVVNGPASNEFALAVLRLLPVHKSLPSRPTPNRRQPRRRDTPAPASVATPTPIQLEPLDPVYTPALVSLCHVIRRFQISRAVIRAKMSLWMRISGRSNVELPVVREAAALADVRSPLESVEAALRDFCAFALHCAWSEDILMDMEADFLTLVL